MLLDDEDFDFSALFRDRPPRRPLPPPPITDDDWLVIEPGSPGVVVSTTKALDVTILRWGSDHPFRGTPDPHQIADEREWVFQRLAIEWVYRTHPRTYRARVVHLPAMAIFVLHRSAFAIRTPTNAILRCAGLPLPPPALLDTILTEAGLRLHVLLPPERSSTRTRKSRKRTPPEEPSTSVEPSSEPPPEQPT